MKDNKILYNDMLRTNSEDEWEGMASTIKACVWYEKSIPMLLKLTVLKPNSDCLKVYTMWLAVSCSCYAT